MGAVADVGFFEALWQQNFQRLPNEFIAAVAEHGFSFSIDQHDAAPAINDDNSHRRRLQESAKPLLALSERLLRGFRFYSIGHCSLRTNFTAGSISYLAFNDNEMGLSDKIN